MSAHLYALQVAGDLKRRLDVDGLEMIRHAQNDYKLDQMRADDLRGRKRRKAHKAADARFRENVAIASQREVNGYALALASSREEGGAR